MSDINEGDPVVGAPVQFCVGFDPSGQPVYQAALITGIVNLQQRVAALALFSPNGVQFVVGAPYAWGDSKPGHWQWLKRPSPVVMAKQVMVPNAA